MNVWARGAGREGIGEKTKGKQSKGKEIRGDENPAGRGRQRESDASISIADSSFLGSFLCSYLRGGGNLHNVN